MATRNKFLRIIANTIYNNTFRTSMCETLPLAEKVLRAMEDAGIFPPIPIEHLGYQGNDDSTLPVSLCKWEKDDGKLDPYDPTIWEDKRGNKRGNK